LSELNDKEKQVEQFLKLNQADNRGKLKIYIGMSAGVGKTYRMLEEAHDLLQKGVNIKVAYVETHGRKETQALIEGLPIIPRREVFYKGKKLDELDVQAILLLHPDIVIVMNWLIQISREVKMKNAGRM
jgi:two-component system sensor histidine kinase KdpD